MNKLVLILLITSTSFGQSFTKLDVLKFKDLTKVEALMYKKGMRNIKTTTNNKNINIKYKKRYLK